MKNATEDIAKEWMTRAVCAMHGKSEKEAEKVLNEFEKKWMLRKMLSTPEKGRYKLSVTIKEKCPTSS